MCIQTITRSSDLQLVNDVKKGRNVHTYIHTYILFTNLVCDSTVEVYITAINFIYT